MPRKPCLLTAWCLAQPAEQVFRAENDWKPGWKQLGVEVGSGVAIGGEKVADPSLTYFIILLQVS